MVIVCQKPASITIVFWKPGTSWTLVMGLLLGDVYQSRKRIKGGQLCFKINMCRYGAYWVEWRHSLRTRNAIMHLAGPVAEQQLYHCTSYTVVHILLGSNSMSGGESKISLHLIWSRNVPHMSKGSCILTRGTAYFRNTLPRQPTLRRVFAFRHLFMGA